MNSLIHNKLFGINHKVRHLMLESLSFHSYSANLYSTSIAIHSVQMPKAGISDMHLCSEFSNHSRLFESHCKFMTPDAR